MEPLLTVDDLAEVLHRSHEWVARAAGRGDIPSRKVGHKRLFKPSDVEKYLERVAQDKSNIFRTPIKGRRRNA